MYRLLIVTDDQNVRDMFASMQGWENMSIKPPRLRATVEEAVECLGKHPIDAIAVQPSPAFDSLISYLDTNYPNMPIFAIEPNAEKQMQTVRELYNLLTRIHADDTNDDYDPARMLEQLRLRWLRKLMAGLMPSAEVIEKQLRLYRCSERMGVPCVVARMELPEDGSFLNERWHYGGERLEMALRNFFGCEHDHMRMRVAVVSLVEARVLFYPMDEREGISEEAVNAYVRETVEQIANYLGLEMKVLETRRIDGMAAFASENAENA